MQEALTKVMKCLIEAFYTQDTPQKVIDQCLEKSELTLSEKYKNELIDCLEKYSNEY